MNSSDDSDVRTEIGPQMAKERDHVTAGVTVGLVQKPGTLIRIDVDSADTAAEL